jgi:ubiquinone/menaquinone biosynthesis C-methylase UbiE
MLLQVIGEFDRSKPKRILDAGCGSGNLEELVINDPVMVECLDSSESMLQKAINKFRKYDKFNFIKSNFENNLPYQDNSFDIVICINTVHIIKNYEHFINELQRVLRINGRMILVIPKKHINPFLFIYNNIKQASIKSPIKIAGVLLSLLVLIPFSIIITLHENNKKIIDFTNLLRRNTDFSIKDTYLHQAYMVTAHKICRV